MNSIQNIVHKPTIGIGSVFSVLALTNLSHTYNQHSFTGTLGNEQYSLNMMPFATESWKEWIGNSSYDSLQAANYVVANSEEGIEPNVKDFREKKLRVKSIFRIKLKYNRCY